MYRIGLFSKITKTTVKTLRYYDEVGLLKPAKIDRENGYRYYTTDQLFELHQIIALRQIGFSIDEILSIISGHKVDEILSKKRSELENSVRDMEDKLSRINYYMKERSGESSMKYQVVVKDLPEVIVFSKRATLKNYSDYFSFIPAIGEEVTSLNPNLKCRVPEYSFVINHDGEYKEQDVDVEYCEAVESVGIGSDEIKFKTIPAVKAVTILHKGPYEELPKAYAYIFKWIEENGYQVKDNARESYIDGIWNKEDPNEWLTEIQVPIK